jgi:hypothetical protein
MRPLYSALPSDMAEKIHKMYECQNQLVLSLRKSYVENLLVLTFHSEGANHQHSGPEYKDRIHRS